MSELQQTDARPASKNAVKLCEGKIADIQNVWQLLRDEARRAVSDEACMAHLVEDVILSRETPAAALGARLARRLGQTNIAEEF